MGAVSMGRVVSAALDPILVPAGFTAGQFSDHLQARNQVIFCARHSAFSERHPRLPQANQQSGSGTCTDLVIEISGDGDVTSVDLEGISLDETLRAVGLQAEGDSVAAVLGRPWAAALPTLEAALDRLFASP